jgi:Na+/melibiose symporter-like transporter
MGLFGGLFMVPIFLQQVVGLTPLHAGLILLPALPFSGLSGLLTGRLSDRFPPPLVAIAGLLALTAVFQTFTTVTAATTVAVLVGYMILYRTFMDTVGIPITALTVQTLDPDQVRMGQGLLGVMRSIGASFGVTVISVFFERRHTWHQLQAYANYDHASPTHATTVQDLRLSLHQAGMSENVTENEALAAIRAQIDLEAIATAFQESFWLICLCFVVAIVPMCCLLSRRFGVRMPAP